MVFNWLFDSPDEQSQEGQDSNSNDGLLVTEKQNQLSNLSKINVDDLSQNNGKEELMSVQKINPQKRTNVEAVEVNSDPMNNGTSINLSLTANDVLRKINQEAQQLMNDGVNKIRQSLKADRVLVYGFNPDGSGKILAESLDSGWSRAGSAFDQDYFISENNAKPYYVVNDISTKNFALCFVESLEAIEAQAYINVPIKYNNELLGFLSAYQNSSPRDWQESEVQMMVNCATQFRLPLQQTAFMRHNQFREQQREKAIKRERGLAQMLEQIRNATEEDKIFQIATQEGRKFLEVDRLAIYRFEPDWSGKFIAESVAAGWTKLIDTMLVVQDTFLQENQGGRYKLGECFTVDDIYLVGHQPCHIQLLEQFEARAYMIAPIFSANKKLWGLIAAYQNTGARKWQLDEAESLRQLGLQVGIGMTNINSIKEIENQVKEQEKIAQQERTVAKLVQKVQQSEDLRDIFRTATNEVRQLLECDRVVVYQFKEDWSGEVLAESMSSGWVSVMQLQETDDELYSTEMNASSSCTLKYLQSSSALDNDTYFKFNQGGDYTRGKKFQVVNDIYSAGFSACYLQSLEKYQAKAYMIVPIFQENKLWGLFAVYQNSGIREWYSDELNLLLKIAPQLGIAIEQAEKTEQLRKTVARQRSLSQMVDRMRDTSSLENVLEIAAQETRKLLGGDRSSIYQFNADWTGQNVVEAPIDKEFKSLQDSCFLSTFANNSYPYLQKNQGGKYRDGESCIVSDISESNLEQRLIEVLERLDIKAYVRMPIFVEQQLWGIINIYQSRTRVWQQEDIELLRRIVVQVGIVIQQKQNLAALQTQAQQEKTISKIVQRIGGSIKLTEIFRTATQEVRQLLKVDRAVVYRFNPDWTGEVLAESAGSEWVSVMELQGTDETLFSKEMNANEQCTLKNLQAGSALDQDTYFINTKGGDYTRGKEFNVVNDVYSAGFSACYLQSLEKYQARAYIIVPIFQNGKLWGLFAVYQNSGPREWKPDELNLLLRIAPPLGIAIQQTEYLEELQTQTEQEKTISKIVQRVSSSRSLPEIFRNATQEVRKLLEVDRAVVYRFNPDWTGEVLAESAGSEWISVMEIQKTDPTLFSKEMNANEQCTLKNLQAGSALDQDTYFINTQGGDYTRGKQFNVVNDVYSAGFSSCYLQSLEKYQARAYIIVPVFQNNKLWGLFAVYQNSGPREWKTNELNLLLRIAPQLGIAIEQAELLGKIQTNNQELTRRSEQESAIIQFSSRLMSRFAGLMQKSNNPKKIMEFATSELRRVLEADRVTVYRFAPNWSGTFVVESVGAGWPKLVGTELAEVKDSYLQENQGGRYIKGECSQVNDIYQVEEHDLPLTLLEELKTKAYLVVPIFKGEKLWGLLGIYQNDQPRQWDSSEQAILEQVATNIGVTLQVGEYFTKLRSQEEQLSKLVKQERNQRESLQQGALRVLRALEPSFRGDLTVRAPLSEDEIGTIADGYNTTIQSMRGLVRQVQISASRVSDTSSANSQSVSELSEQARMQVQQLQQALRQLEFMVSSTEEVATCANKVEETVEEANRTVQAGDSLMERTVDEIMEIRHTVSDTAKKIKRLGETFQKITKVVSLIENFATQTNLLALNAAIEATRAGEYGKGFAVVADEVRSLAYQSANATTEISRLVEEIQTETNDVTEAMEVGIAQVVNGTNLVRETQQSLNAIVTSTNDIKELVQEITQAATNQSQQSQMLTKVMMDVSAIAGETSEGAAQISASFGELETTSRELQTSVSQFKVD